ncbi:hypothetical protein C823_005135 [Eubacterium plexicaudatum ASF492]|uniref:Uncharacterized protein n=1 Tax=Eubacterium plexicaudatum ASF492 TaxID=1235802 RepID=N1ZPX5_9FIRM|nr:hypothetical protein C823_005135 [Eubacterium plexicaudatum ASF492]
MAFYNVCPKCGANLDPNERCDCEETAEKEKKARDQLLAMEKGTNQLTFNWSLGKAGL